MLKLALQALNSIRWQIIKQNNTRYTKENIWRIMLIQNKHIRQNYDKQDKKIVLIIIPYWKNSP